MTQNAIILALALSGAFTSLFDGHDTHVPAAFAAARARYECVTLHGVQIDRSEVRGDDAIADLTVDATAYLPLTRAEREFPPHWHVHFKRRANRWQVDDASIPEAALAQKLAEGKAASADEAPLFDGELVRQLCDLAYDISVKGQFAKSADEAELALALAREVAPLEAARAYWMIGRAHDLVYDEDAAAPAFEEARKLAAESGDREIEARALIGIAWVHLSNADYAGVKAPLDAGLQLAETLGQHGAASEAYLARANTAVQGSEDLIGGLHAYEQALAHAALGGNPALEGSILGNIGGVYDRLANYELASSYYRRAVALFRKVGNKRGVLRNLRNLASVEESYGNLGTASRYAREIDELLKETPNARTAAYNAFTWAQIHADRQEWAEAEKKGLEALAGAKESHTDPLIAHANLLLAQVRFAQRRYRESVGLAEQAVAEAKDFDVYWNAKLEAGKAWVKLGEREKARASIQDAIDAIELRRSSVPGSTESEQLYWNEKTGAYYTMFRLYAANHDMETAISYVERARARTLLAALAAGKVKSTRGLTPDEVRDEQQLDAEIAAANVALRDARSQDVPDAALIARLEKQLDQKRIDRFALNTQLYTNHPDLSLARGDVPIPPLAQLRAAIPPDGVVLEYVVNFDSAALLVVTRDAEPRMYPLPGSWRTLKPLAQGLVSAIARRDLEFKGRARKLYDLLIGPAARELASKKIVCIITDGVLWGVPFQALVAPSGHYFIEDHPIFYAPSLTLLSWYVTHKRNAPHERTLLALADSRLAGADSEVRRIASLYPSPESLVLTGRRATESRFKREAGDFRILHLATHGTFEDAQPMFSHIDLARAPGDPDDGILEAREIAQLHLHAGLAILASCESARGPFRMGEGVVGISWALLAAGCPRAVLTQWKIASESSRDLMIDFHRRLASHPELTGRAATDALRRAQTEMLKQSAYAHPFYWSAFILVGDGW